MWLKRFDDRLGDTYYAVRRGDGREQLDARLADLERALEAGRTSPAASTASPTSATCRGFCAAQERLDVELDAFPALADWLERLGALPAIAAERELVAAL